MTPMPLGLFVIKLQPKVGLGGYDILFAYFVVEEKSKTLNLKFKDENVFYLLKHFLRKNQKKALQIFLIASSKKS